MRAGLLLATLAGLAACSPDNPDGKVAADAAMPAVRGGTTVPPAATPTTANDLPDDFARTAWRVEDEEGARYTTFLDGGGRYRDHRNGDAWREGIWKVDAQGRLCLTPDGEGALEQCWTPESMDGRGAEDEAMIVRGDSGRRVRLVSVEYRAPVVIQEPAQDQDQSAAPTAS